MINRRLIQELRQDMKSTREFRGLDLSPRNVRQYLASKILNEMIEKEKTGSRINEKDKKDNTPTSSKYFIVWGSAGRFNGSAIVNAKDAKDARRIIKESDWLDTGKIDSVQSYEAYQKDMDIEEDEAKDDFAKVPNYGDWEELEWGS